jgi:hypothetical protein
MRHVVNALAAQGRHGDDTLVHVSHGELQGLQALSGRPLTRNPHTGLPEAWGFDWTSLLPMVAGAAGTMVGGPMGGMAAGAAAGGLRAKMQGSSVGMGLVTGLAAGYGGSGLAQGVMGMANAGAGAAATAPATDLAASGVAAAPAEYASFAPTATQYGAMGEAPLNAAAPAVSNVPQEAFRASEIASQNAAVPAGGFDKFKAGLQNFNNTPLENKWDMLKNSGISQGQLAGAYMGTVAAPMPAAESSSGDNGYKPDVEKYKDPVTGMWRVRVRNRPKFAEGGTIGDGSGDSLGLTFSETGPDTTYDAARYAQGAPEQYGIWTDPTPGSYPGGGPWAGGGAPQQSALRTAIMNANQPTYVLQKPGAVGAGLGSISDYLNKYKEQSKAVPTVVDSPFTKSTSSTPPPGGGGGGDGSAPPGDTFPAPPPPIVQPPPIEVQEPDQPPPGDEGMWYPPEAPPVGDESMWYPPEAPPEEPPLHTGSVSVGDMVDVPEELLHTGSVSVGDMVDVPEELLHTGSVSVGDMVDVPTSEPTFATIGEQPAPPVSDGDWWDVGQPVDWAYSNWEGGPQAPMTSTDVTPTLAWNGDTGLWQVVDKLSDPFNPNATWEGGANGAQGDYAVLPGANPGVSWIAPIDNLQIGSTYGGEIGTSGAPGAGLVGGGMNGIHALNAKGGLLSARRYATGGTVSPTYRTPSDPYSSYDNWTPNQGWTSAQQNAWMQDPRATATYAPDSIEAQMQAQDLGNWDSSKVSQLAMGPQLLSYLNQQQAMQAQGRANAQAQAQNHHYAAQPGASHPDRGGAPQGITSLAPPAATAPTPSTPTGYTPPAYTAPAPSSTAAAPQVPSYLDYARMQSQSQQTQPAPRYAPAYAGPRTMLPPSITAIPNSAPAPAAAPAATGMARGGIASVGQYLRGPGDGMSDHIPAQVGGPGGQQIRVAANEYVVPADVVSHLGNGSSDAGARVLDSMGAKVRKARTGNPKQGKQINPGKFMPR